MHPSFCRASRHSHTATAPSLKFSHLEAKMAAAGAEAAVEGWRDSLVWIQETNNNENKLWSSGRITEISFLDDDKIWNVTVALDPSDPEKAEKTEQIISIQTKGSYHESTRELELESIYHRLDDSKDPYLHYHDLAQLPYINEPEILSILHRRYTIQQPFVFIGPILLTVNPFINIEFYDDHHLQQYIRYGELRNLTHLPSHLYKIAHTAYHHMFIDLFDQDKRENQTIVITGDSGAGKTECSKSLIHYYCLLSRYTQSWVRNATLTTVVKTSNYQEQQSVSQDDETTIEGLILLTDAITESLGNAQTLQNNNSSRFGKYIELYYSIEGKIEGVSIRTYLLESTRVTHHSAHERNFHIFYQLYAGLSSDEKKKLGFDSLESFYYLNSQQSSNEPTITSVGTLVESDLEKYQQLINSFDQFNISREAQQEMFKVFIGILHTGNISFVMPNTGDDETSVGGCDISSTELTQFHLLKTCELMGYTQEALREILCYQKTTVHGVEVKTGLSIPFAVAMRDRLARTLYYSLFKWIMTEINLVLSENTSATALSWIGILDIFGFENIEKNSLEQLCESSPSLSVSLPISLCLSLSLSLSLSVSFSPSLSVSLSPDPRPSSP
jgi:myosin V